MTTTYTLIETNPTALDFSDKESLLAYLSPTVAPNQKWPFTNQVSQPEVTAVEPTDIEKIMHLLEDPRFTLRTVSSIEARTGLTSAQITAELRYNYVEYITRTKRGTREELIGLASRN